MKALTALTAAALIAAPLPLLAHGGAHIHPHGAESWFGLVLGACLIAAAALAAIKVRK